MSAPPARPAPGAPRAPRAPRARRGKLRRKLLALGLSGAFALLGAELVIRARSGVPLAERLPILRVQANALRGWEMVPGEDHHTYEHLVHVNSLGLRGPELAPKAPGERRVLVLGDSLTYGQGVADDQTLPRHLEEVLAELDDGVRWTVVNGGLRAYDTEQELGLFEELGGRIEPDVVVLAWFWNDLRDQDRQATYRRLLASGPIAFDAGAPLEGRALFAWRAKQLLRRSALVMEAHDTWRAAVHRPPEHAATSQGLVRLRGSLRRFIELCALHGANGIFAVVPDAALIRGQHASAEVAAAAAELARSAGLPVVELLPALRELCAGLARPPLVPYDGHYLGSANRAMAQALARVLAGG